MFYFTPEEFEQGVKEVFEAFCYCYCELCCPFQKSGTIDWDVWIKHDCGWHQLQREIQQSTIQPVSKMTLLQFQKCARSCGLTTIGIPTRDMIDDLRVSVPRFLHSVDLEAIFELCRKDFVVYQRKVVQQHTSFRKSRSNWELEDCCSDMGKEEGEENWRRDMFSFSKVWKPALWRESLSSEENLFESNIKEDDCIGLEEFKFAFKRLAKLLWPSSSTIEGQHQCLGACLSAIRKDPSEQSKYESNSFYY